MGYRRREIINVEPIDAERFAPIYHSGPIGHCIARKSGINVAIKRRNYRWSGANTQVARIGAAITTPERDVAVVVDVRPCIGGAKIIDRETQPNQRATAVVVSCQCVRLKCRTGVDRVSEC